MKYLGRATVEGKLRAAPIMLAMVAGILAACLLQPASSQTPGATVQSPPLTAEEVAALKNPIPFSNDSIAAGRKLYLADPRCVPWVGRESAPGHRGRQRDGPDRPQILDYYGTEPGEIFNRFAMAGARTCRPSRERSPKRPTSGALSISYKACGRRIVSPQSNRRRNPNGEDHDGDKAGTPNNSGSGARKRIAPRQNAGPRVDSSYTLWPLAPLLRRRCRCSPAGSSQERPACQFPPFKSREKFRNRSPMPRRPIR